MKTTIKKITSLALVFVLIVSLVACATVDATGVWENATYLKDMEFGKGEKTVTVEVAVEEQLVTFTIHTDKDTVGSALLEHGLIDGEQGAYGLYIKSVNGIVADYDVDGYYWGFYKGGEFMLTGVDGTAIVGGESFELVREK